MKIKKILSFSFLLIFYISAAQKTIPNITLQNFENNLVNMSSITNEPLVILSFWATWCLPCINELNAINEVSEKWQKETGVKIIAVSIDDNRTISKVKPMVRSNGWNYEIVFDKNQDLKRALQIVDIPYTLILQNGKIVFQHTGYSPGNEDLLYAKLMEVISKK